MSRNQLKLFKDPGTQLGVSQLVASDRIHVSRSTFLGGLAAKVHRWFRLTPSFGPELVQEALAEMSTAQCSAIFDPFAGAGTTLIEARLEGHVAFGCEINPFLHFVCETSLNWELDSGSLLEGLRRIRDLFEKTREEAEDVNGSPTELPFPQIHNVHRWWRADVLRELLYLLKAVRSHSDDRTYVRFFELALAGVLVPDLTNVTLGRLQLHFISREKDVIRVWETFERHAKQMISDVEEVSRLRGLSPATVLQADSTSSTALNGLPRFDRVVTSPPYPNRYSYVWNTRPHLYLFNFFSTARQAALLDKRTVGGTWGSATSDLIKGEVSAAFPVIKRLVSPLADKIRRSDNLMANYLMKYFNQLASQIVCQDNLLAEDAQMAYVVGCSWLKGVYVETDVLLAKVFEGLDLNYKVKSIRRFRRRHSGKDLHESIVYVQRLGRL